MSMPSSSVPLARPADAPTVELDVRDDLRNGREPFVRIMAAVDTLPAAAVLHLRAIFEPAPLFKALGKRGFRHEAVAHAPDDWSVWFWRPAAGPPSPDADSDGAARARPAVVLDVRGLEPPEPLTRTLTALETLPAASELVHLNERVPRLLFPILVERGFVYDVDESQPERVVVRIWRSA